MGQTFLLDKCYRRSGINILVRQLLSQKWDKHSCQTKCYFKLGYTILLEKRYLRSWINILARQVLFQSGINNLVRQVLFQSGINNIVRQVLFQSGINILVRQVLSQKWDKQSCQTSVASEVEYTFLLDKCIFKVGYRILLEKRYLRSRINILVRQV